MQILAEEFHDIAPPVDYSLVPPWLIFLICMVSLILIGLLVFYARRFLRKAPPTRSARARAIDSLDAIANEIERTPSYQFSIHISDIVRRYVVEEFHLPMTRQTSVEFLNAIGSTASFSASEKSLLSDFLTRCDLIKFARYEATTEDSRLLLDEARQFVKGEALAPA